jgi:hypothetical protein
VLLLVLRAADVLRAQRGQGRNDEGDGARTCAQVGLC